MHGLRIWCVDSIVLGGFIIDSRAKCIPGKFALLPLSQYHPNAVLGLRFEALACDEDLKKPCSSALPQIFQLRAPVEGAGQVNGLK